MKRIALVTGAALLVAGMGACAPSGGTTAPTSSGSGSEAAPTSAAPTEASSSAASADLADLLLTGSAAGLDFKKLSASDKEQAGGLAKIFKELKVSPAECKAVITKNLSGGAGASGAEASLAQSGDTAYSASVARPKTSLSDARADAEKCTKMTLDLGGIKVPVTSTIEDVTVDGVDEAYRIVTTVKVPQSGDQKGISSVGKVGDVQFSASGQGVGVDQSKVEEIFAAQAKKVIG